MQRIRGRSHGRGDFTTAGIAVGAILGVLGGLPFSDTAMGVGAAVGASTGFIAGAVLDAWAGRG